MTCQHGKEDWRLCAHCTGLAQGARPSAAPDEPSELERLRVEVVNLRGDLAEAEKAFETIWKVARFRYQQDACDHHFPSYLPGWRCPGCGSVMVHRNPFAGPEDA